MLWAVHISDGILATPWWLGGWALAALVLLPLAGFRLRDEEIPRIALLTAAFFIVSLVHVKVGPTSVHLLLTGLLGVLLGLRAPLAILVGLTLQAVLVQHGGILAIGVNTCVLTLPALASAALFHALHRVAWLQRPAGRACLVAGTLLLAYGSLCLSIGLLRSSSLHALGETELQHAWELATQPWVLALGLAIAGAGAWFERKLENAPEFPLGLLVGELTVLLTLAVHGFVLIAGGEEVWHTSALVWTLAHLPLALVEGIILGVVVGFLAQVKPSMLARAAAWPPST